MSRTMPRRFFRHGLMPQLLVFATVARLGSVTRAAEELHLAQPTVSMQLKKLGETLDVRLFEQHGRKLHLTAAGHALREACDELMDCLSRAEERLAPWRSPQGELLVIAAEPQAREVASRLLASFCAHHPGVEGSLHVASRAELLERFSNAVDDVYVFEIPREAADDEPRWTVAHAKGKGLARSAAQFLRETLATGGSSAA